MHNIATDSETESTSDAQKNARIGTAGELLKVLQEEGIIGMWKDRDDIDDSVEFARNLRKQATKRNHDE